MIDARRRDEMVAAGYPRPQLARESWIDLGGEWELAFDPDDMGRRAGWGAGITGPFGLKIAVPYPPESPLSGVGDNGFHPIIWYRRRVAVPPLAVGERLILHFGAVDYQADVWVNGHFLGGHEGGQVPFSFDATHAAAGQAATGQPGAVVVVRAADDPVDPDQPRGKQDWRPEPHDIWYHRTTGIWQPVWFEVVPDLHIEALEWDPDLSSARLTCWVTLSHEPPPDSSVRVRLTLDGEVLADNLASVGGRQHRLDLFIPAARNAWDWNRLSWSPASPVLINASVTLESPAGRDVVTSYTALRSVAVTDGHFLLNGRPFFLRMALEQGYWPQSHLAAPSPAALRAEVELAKDLGLNGLRIHQKVEDPRFLYWADRLGLLIWDEMPSPAGFSPTSIARLTSEWQAVVARDRSHPCVVAWVPLNESWGVPGMAGHPERAQLTAALAQLTRALDGSRPVISNDGWEHVDSDIWTVHDYGKTGASLRERYETPEAVERTLGERWPGPHPVILPGASRHGQPVMLTEFGGLTYAPGQPETWRGYGVAVTARELEQRLEDLVLAVCASDVLAGFCYTQLTDTEQERNGLVDEHRRPKLPIARLRAIITHPSRAVPDEEPDPPRD